MIQFHKKAVIKNRPAWMGGRFFLLQVSNIIKSMMNSSMPQYGGLRMVIVFPMLTVLTNLVKK
jgi:hypothetical protein